jgi:hypothetical protein
MAKLRRVQRLWRSGTTSITYWNVVHMPAETVAMPVTVRKADTDLSESLRRDADAGPIITPSYMVLNRKDLAWLLARIDAEIDEREFEIAWQRRSEGEPEGASLDDMREKYGL